MGYTTEFEGSVTVTPPLSAEEVAFVNKFSETRRMDRANGPYYCGTGSFGQDHEPDIRKYNSPPEGQPGLWCQWVASEDGTTIGWNDAEKFYCAAEWMQYIIDHFVGANPIARNGQRSVDRADRFAFLQGHHIEGDIFATGEESSDVWKIQVRDNIVTKVNGHVSYQAEPEKGPGANLDALARTRQRIQDARLNWDEQVEGKLRLDVSKETFELFLRDLEEASGLR